jgi:hypothetical protein
VPANSGSPSLSDISNNSGNRCVRRNGSQGGYVVSSAIPQKARHPVCRLLDEETISRLFARLSPSDLSPLGLSLLRETRSGHRGYSLIYMAAGRAER